MCTKLLLWHLKIKISIIIKGNCQIDHQDNLFIFSWGEVCEIWNIMAKLCKIMTFSRWISHQWKTNLTHLRIWEFSLEKSEQQNLNSRNMKYIRWIEEIAPCFHHYWYICMEIALLYWLIRISGSCRNWWIISLWWLQLLTSTVIPLVGKVFVFGLSVGVNR